MRFYRITLFFLIPRLIIESTRQNGPSQINADFRYLKVQLSPLYYPQLSGLSAVLDEYVLRELKAETKSRSLNRYQIIGETDLSLKSVSVWNILSLPDKNACLFYLPYFLYKRMYLVKNCNVSFFQLCYLIMRTDCSKKKVNEPCQRTFIRLQTN